MDIAKDIEIFTKEVTWRNNAAIPFGDNGGSADVLYLTEKGRAGVIKKASMRDWRWLTDKYHIKYWTYLNELIFF